MTATATMLDAQAAQLLAHLHRAGNYHTSGSSATSAQPGGTAQEHRRCRRRLICTSA